MQNLLTKEQSNKLQVQTKSWYFGKSGWGLPVNPSKRTYNLWPYILEDNGEFQLLKTQHH